MDYLARQERVRAALEEAKLDALIVAAAANVQYLSGFRGEGLLVVGEGVGLVSDGRYQREAAAAAVTERLCEAGNFWHGVARLVRAAGYRRVGFEAQHTTVAAWETLQKELQGVELVPERQVVERLRVGKEPAEIELLRQAAAIADAAYGAFMEAEVWGQSERLAALELTRLMVERGAEQAAFAPIVAGGKHAAEPHHQPTEQPIGPPGPLKLDLGARYCGYCSDLTRTVFLGEPDETFRRVYKAVYEAQQRALAAVRPGLAARELDAVARELLAAAGFKEQFAHGLGHGVGLEVHELPRLSPSSEDVLAAGQVITIEPGVYLEGWGGVRLEDLVLVTADGAEVLSHAPKLAPAEW